MSDAQDLVAFKGEVQLAGYNDSHTQGARVTFWLPDPEQLDVFRGACARRGGKAGQRYMLVLVEIDDDEKPVDQAQRAKVEEAMKGGPISAHAARLCRDEQFQTWIARGGGERSEAGARAFILATCGIASRRELDHSTRARQAYETLVRRPFVKWTWGG